MYATPDLVVVWTFNEDAGESGTAAAAFIDPAANQVAATTKLPADATVPFVLDDAVYFPAADGGTVSAVVDRASWQVTATLDYGRPIGGSQVAFDGRSMYPLAGVDVIAVDPDSYELTEVIEPLTIVTHRNALAVSPGALWVAGGGSGILQRFDIS